MVVKTQGKGCEVLGLHVGAANARRYFPKDRGTVELQLGDLHIECQLPPKFWDGCPEIHDRRLCEWLKFKTSNAQSNRKPVALAMVQSGSNSFTLESISLQGRRATRAQSAA